MVNLKFIVFLYRHQIEKKKTICSKRYSTKLENKGIVAIEYYNWKEYFQENKILLPTFDINESSPTMGIIYKRFTDSKYLSLNNYDSYLFQEQCRSLSTLVSYLGASLVNVTQKIGDKEHMGIKTDVKIMDEAKVGVKYEKNKQANYERVGTKEFSENVEYYISMGGKKFDQCASEGGLYGVDKDIYTRLYFVNIVSERFNGQKKSYFNIQKTINSSEILEIGAYVKKLNIGINFSYDKSKQKEETYTFTIEYYDLDTVMANALKKVEQEKKKEATKLEKIKKHIHKNRLLKSSIGSTFNPNLFSSENNETDNNGNSHEEDIYGDTNIFDDTNVYNSAIQTSLSYDEDDADDLDDIDVKLTIAKQEKRKGKNQSIYIRQIRDIVDEYVDGLGIKNEFEMWKSNKENMSKCNSRCKWIKNTCDIDYFLRDIGIL